MLTTGDIRKLKAKLESERRTLIDEAHEELLRAQSTGYADLAGESPDFGDQSTAISLVEYDNAMARRHAAALHEIDAALARVEDGTYGRCADCHADINRGRLEAFPTARRCADCQGRHERTYAHEGTPSL
jgi:RNA polymerase-binding transcription factor DksA